MASLTAKKINGRTYYYLRETARVDGKPKVVRQKYLGTAEAVAKALQDQPVVTAPRPEAASFAFADVAALYALAREIGLVDLIDRHVPKRGGKAPSVGTYLLIAAINRCVRPLSKAQIGEWFAETSLPRLMKVKASQLTSQRFWDNMDRVSIEAIRQIEEELTKKLVTQFDLDSRILFYDATNFFTFIDTFNERNTVAQRGKCKRGTGLRILGLALLVTGDFQVPLFHRLYPGNQPDAPTFRSLGEELIERYKLLIGGAVDLTIVFDKGNNAKDNIETLSDSPWHFVGSLVPTQHPELLDLEVKEMSLLDKQLFPHGVRARRTKKKVFGREFTVLVTFNPELFEAQVKTIEREVAKRREKLERYRRYTVRWLQGRGTGKPPTVAGTKKAVGKILVGRHMKDLFSVSIDLDPETDGLPRLTYRFDEKAWKRLKRTLLGKTILFTDRREWTDEEIVLAYRGQHHVENSFRQMKDVTHVSFRPAYHWTDQKLHVHAFYCVLALMLASLLRRRLAEKGIRVSTHRMLQLLGKIREIHVLTGSGRGRPRTHRIHSKVDDEAARLFTALDLQGLLGN